MTHANPGRLRLAYARLAQETNALSPVLTTLDDFDSMHHLRGEELGRACERGAQEAEGFLANAELSGFVRACRDAGDVDLVPLSSAWAIPSGPLSRECFDALMDELLEGLRAQLPLDGLYLCLHGAMGVEGLRDPESVLLERVREVIGDMPLAVTMDLHANLTQRRMDAMDIIVGYATNPHRDHVRTAKLAAKILLGKLRGTYTPTTAWRTLPLLVGGGTTLDFLPPMRSIFRRMRMLERRGEVLSASVFMCHVWNDDPDLGWSVVVTTDGDQAKAERLAEELADRCWKVRHKRPPQFASAEDAIAQAQRMKLRRKLGTITLADASDVVTAGAPGDTTGVLRALLDGGKGLRAYVPMRDPRAVERLWGEAVGTKLTLEVGASLDPEGSDAIEVTGELRRKQEVPGMKRQCVLRIGDVDLVITEGPPLTIRPSFFSDVGLDPWKADVLVVKNFFPFRIFFLPHSRKTIYVKTKGRTDMDASFGLDFAEPLYPIADVAEWRPTDARRRGLAD